MTDGELLPPAVLQRKAVVYVRQSTQAQVEANYRYHVGYRDAEHPGGQEDGNLRFLREFDCALLQPGAAVDPNGSGR